MRRLDLVSIAVASLTLAGLARAGGSVKFPHAVHVDDSGVECTTCHISGKKGAPKLSNASCGDCHTPVPKYVFAPKAKRLATPFPHARHETGRKCVDCHKAILTPAWTAGNVMMPIGECKSCHKFGHKLHVEDSGVECTTCHVSSKKGGPQLSEASCGDCHSDGVPPYQVEPKAKRLAGGFPHAQHEKTAKCLECHKAILTAAWTSGGPMMEQRACVSCHVFRHKQHIEDAGAECTTCHLGQKQGAPQLADNACGDCHSDGIPPYEFKPKARRMSIGFPHPVHEGAAKCLDCHNAILTAEWTAGKAMSDEPACERCHDENGVDVPISGCAACHGRDQSKVAPADHDAKWAARHSTTKLASIAPVHGQQCQLCHGADVCTRCHAESVPKSHNALFRERTHSLAATYSAERCSTCHTTSYCFQCHSKKAPQDHHGLWRVRVHGVAGSYDRERCAMCHSPAACVQCHATTRPLNHTAAWRDYHGQVAQTESNETCLTCHRLSACAACHPPRR